MVTESQENPFFFFNFHKKLKQFYILLEAKIFFYLYYIIINDWRLYPAIDDKVISTTEI